MTQPRTSVHGLEKSARAQATKLGHELKRFRQRGPGKAEAECRHCKAGVALSLDERASRKITGDAVNVKCDSTASSA